jgi:hypothetical protein
MSGSNLRKSAYGRDQVPIILSRTLAETWKKRATWCFFALQIRHRFGCYDEITEVDRRRVRHCNWVRFLRAASTYSDEVNMIGTKVKGKRHLNVFFPLFGMEWILVHYY